jgi:hypothetical protein
VTIPLIISEIDTKKRKIHNLLAKGKALRTNKQDVENDKNVFCVCKYL